MYFILERIAGTSGIDVRQYETLDVLIKHRLRGRNAAYIKKCTTVEEFMGQYPPNCHGILVIEGDILPVRAHQNMVTTWSVAGHIAGHSEEDEPSRADLLDLSEAGDESL